MTKVFFIFDRNYGNFRETVYCIKAQAESALAEAEKRNKELYNNRYNWQIVELTVCPKGEELNDNTA